MRIAMRPYQPHRFTDTTVRIAMRPYYPWVSVLTPTFHFSLKNLSLPILDIHPTAVYHEANGDEEGE